MRCWARNAKFALTKKGGCGQYQAGGGRLGWDEHNIRLRYGIGARYRSVRSGYDTVCIPDKLLHIWGYATDRAISPTSLAGFLR